MAIVIVGGGVIGLATANALLSLMISRKGGRNASSSKRVIVIEKSRYFGNGASSRNSQVIHSALYYPQESKKYQFCVTGNIKLYNFCTRHGIPFRPCGKWLIARTHEEAQYLTSTILQNPHLTDQEGHFSYHFVSKQKAALLEPHLRADRAKAIVNIQSTGVVDTHSLIACLMDRIDRKGGMLCHSHCLHKVRFSETGPVLTIKGPDGSDFEMETDIVINCAGIHADTVASLLNTDTPYPRQKWILGRYAKLRGSVPNLFSRLVYPISIKTMSLKSASDLGNTLGGLGIHSLLDPITGEAGVFGPDAIVTLPRGSTFQDPLLAAQHGDDQKLVQMFADSIATYVRIDAKDLASRLALDYCGVRSRSENGDFHLDWADRDRMAFNCIGIESPGLTSSLAIADHIASAVLDRLSIK